ncbi:MAG: biopolymer transporter ExbD [Sphingobacteriales bacterium 41-5]|nr:MAG: biopolymer transporter ExbD [Sphingobacteriales bacterium 41-5]
MSSRKVVKSVPVMDMTPFVDVTLLILMFFIMATKFKPPEPVPIKTPNSVSSQPMPDNNAVVIGIDKDDKVYFTIQSEKDPQKAWDIIVRASEARGMPVPMELAKKYQSGDVIGFPFSQLQGYLKLPRDQALKAPQPGIPVKDSASSELFYWIGAAKQVFAGETLKYLIKGDNGSKYPAFAAVIDALKRNDEQKYNLVTMPESVPVGTDLYKERLGSERDVRSKKAAGSN